MTLTSALLAEVAACHDVGPRRDEEIQFRQLPVKVAYQCRVFEKPLIPKSDEVMAISTIVTEPLSMLTEYRKKLAVNINCIKVAHSSGGSR